jgi:hypothetical protein
MWPRAMTSFLDNPMSLSDLLAIPEPVSQAADVLAGFDGCLRVGFGRLGPEQGQALQALTRICAGTPLQEPVATAVEALTRSEFLDQHFAALAAARAALQGAQYDALRAHAAEALGRKLPEETPSPPPDGQVSGPIATWQESTRHWLTELALAGFGQLEYQTLAPFTATLEQLQGEPRATRLSALLTGFLEELLRHVPTSAMTSLPIYRWADLWTRSMLASLRAPATPQGKKVSCTFSVLGVDIRHHGYFVCFDAYGLLEADGQTRPARVTQSSYKVDVVVDGEMWQCCSTKIDALLKAIAERAALQIDDMTLLPTGDLLWDGKAKAGKQFLAMDLARKKLNDGSDIPLSAPVAPDDRHPIQIAELIYLGDYTVKKGNPPTLDVGGTELPVAIERLSRASEITADDITASTAMIGLLRFDAGRWSVQPLALTLGGKKFGEVWTGSAVYDNLKKKKKGATFAVLQERASRLLRQKA